MTVTIERVGVLGCGLMGSGIAETCARAVVDVVVVESSDDALAAATELPEQVLGLHFFNPVPVLRLVDVVTSRLTGPETLSRVEEFATATLAVANSLYEEFKEPLCAPPPLLLRMVEAGLLGRKSGRGFYEYA